MQWGTFVLLYGLVGILFAPLISWTEDAAILQPSKQPNHANTQPSFRVPLDQNQGWISAKYDRIPANIVERSSHGLSVRVNKSVSPLFYQFEKPQAVSGFRAKVEFLGLPVGKNLNKTNYDDKPLRLGFVVAGDQKPNFMERMFLPKWISDLAARSPSGGIEKVYFYSVATPQTRDLTFAASSRFHQEQVLMEVDRVGEVDFAHQFEASREVIALWFSIDGDDTQSTFETRIHDLVLH